MWLRLYELSRKKIVAVYFLFLDVDLSLHKTSQIQILTNLAELGYDVFLIALHSAKKYQFKNSKMHVTSIPLRFVPLISRIIFAFLVLVFLPFYILYLKPDFIITEPDVTVFGLIPIHLFPRSIRPKIVLDIRSTPVETTGRRGHRYTLCFYTAVYIAKKLFDGMTIITHPMKKKICDRFNINSRLVGVWSSGTSLTLFRPEKNVDKGKMLRKKFGLSRKFIVFYHGNFGSCRGLVETINSIEILKDKFSDIVLFLIGTGPALHVLEELIHKKGIQDRVVIQGPVEHSDVPKFIAMCDVGIVPLPDMPDWRHQCPLKLLEYLAMKKVVIVTDIPANREVIGESKCGIFISSANPDEIANAITYAYNNKEKLTEWGSIGRSIVRKRYSWKRLAKVFENYLQTTRKKSIKL